MSDKLFAGQHPLLKYHRSTAALIFALFCTSATALGVALEGVTPKATIADDFEPDIICVLASGAGVSDGTIADDDRTKADLELEKISVRGAAVGDEAAGFEFVGEKVAGV